MSELEAVRPALSAAARAAAHRIIPGRGPVARVKRRLMRWALELYFRHSLKPHAYSALEPPRRAVAKDARAVLAYLQAVPGEVSRGQLADATGIAGGHLNRIVADMNRRGLVRLSRNHVALSDQTESSDHG